LLGDFIAYSHLWGCVKTDLSGKVIEDVMLKHNISLSDGSFAYIDPASGTKSAIDLGVCHSSLYLNITWKVHDDLCGSDHFPIHVWFEQDAEIEVVSSWKCSKADWESFARLSSNQLGDDCCVLSVDQFTQTLLYIASETIPKNKSSLQERHTVWFNEDCKQAIKIEKSLEKVKSEPTPENIQNHKIMRSKARKTIRTTRRNSWQQFVSKINSRTF